MMTGYAATILIALMFTAVAVEAQVEENSAIPLVVTQPTTQPGDPMPNRMAEIRHVMDQERVAVSELVALLGGTEDHAERMTLQKRIAEVKKNAEVEMLSVQLRYARAGNQGDVVTRLEASIEQILNPVLSLAPVSGSAQNETGSR